LVSKNSEKIFGQNWATFIFFYKKISDLLYVFVKIKIKVSRKNVIFSYLVTKLTLGKCEKGSEWSDWMSRDGPSGSQDNEEFKGVV
jgi:hypothetical protein